jgi:hypothetical protein
MEVVPAVRNRGEVLDKTKQKRNSGTEGMQAAIVDMAKALCGIPGIACPDFAQRLAQKSNTQSKAHWKTSADRCNATRM